MNILFLCTSNLNRSRTAEDYFRSVDNKHTYQSASLSEKYCNHYNTRLCSIELLEWADKIFVMETMHVGRITKHAGVRYLAKIEMLNIDDFYRYIQTELIDQLKLSNPLQFIE